jgi:hypothetical protein
MARRRSDRLLDEAVVRAAYAEEGTECCREVEAIYVYEVGVALCLGSLPILRVCGVAGILHTSTSTIVDECRALLPIEPIPSSSEIIFHGICEQNWRGLV